MTYKQFLDRSRRRRAKIARLAAQGISQAEIARRLGIKRQRVHQILNPAQ